MISIFLPIKKTSKRLKNKNFLKIANFKNGLSEIKILQLLKLSRLLKKKKILSEIIISTDSDKLLNKYDKNKNLKIFKRKKSLTRDDCLEDLIKEVPKICFGKYILWTHTTSPIFCSKDYLDFINFFFKQEKFKSAFSATTISTFFMDANSNWLSHNYNKKKWPRTQDLKKFYFVNNAAFISKRENYIISSDRLDSKPLPIISRKYSDIDIDNKEDFVFFKKIFKNKSIPI
tara:strand:+ start:15941 stop:16633 length:693 start_codon:yes stop_codon:yes gene_type:complete